MMNFHWRIAPIIKTAGLNKAQAKIVEALLEENFRYVYEQGKMDLREELKRLLAIEPCRCETITDDLR